MTEMTHTQETIEALATTEAETALTQEELRTDLGTIRDITLAVNHPMIENTLAVVRPVIEITLDHPETEIIHTQEKIEDLVTAEAETAHT